MLLRELLRAVASEEDPIDTESESSSSSSATGLPRYPSLDLLDPEEEGVAAAPASSAGSASVSVAGGCGGLKVDGIDALSFMKRPERVLRRDRSRSKAGAASSHFVFKPLEFTTSSSMTMLVRRRS